MAFKNPLHFEFFLKIWPFFGPYFLVTFAELGPRQQHFLPYFLEGIPPFFSPFYLPPQGYNHKNQPSNIHLVNPQELFWVWPAFNPLFLPAQAQPLNPPGTLL